MSSTRSPAPREPATEPGAGDTALLICAHGIAGVPGIVEHHAEQIRASGAFREVATCCLKGRPGLRRALATIRGRRVRLVPFLMAEGHTTETVLAKALAGAEDVRIERCRAVGASPRLARLIAERATALAAARGWRTADTSLLLIGHGTRRDPRSGRTLEDQVSRLAAQRRFAAVGGAFLEQRPRVAEALAALGTSRVTVVGFFADRGAHGEEDVPRLLAASGRETLYAGPIGVDPGMVEVILDTARKSLDGGQRETRPEEPADADFA